MKLDRRSLLAAAALGVGGLAASARASEADIFPIVETAQGKVRGIRAGGINMFKGLRYGGDTSGRNRFMPPTPPPKWAGVREATNYGQYCPQIPASRETDYTGLIDFDVQPGGMGEDCLVANIWTPTLDRNARRPVLFHIHGGGYYGGSGNSLGYDGEALARFGDCVVITVNHRIGSLGFNTLAAYGPQYARSGAVGMMDLVQALQWVRDNVEGFGGDPGRVLAFGQSGGGSKTSVLTTMPSAKGLFHRAGVMSCGGGQVVTQEEGQKSAAIWLSAMGIGKADISKVHTLPFQTLVAGQAVMESAARAKGEVPKAFTPVLDGVVLVEKPYDPKAPAVSADVPMIVSNVIGERAYRMTNFDLDEKGLRAFIARRVGEARADAVLAMYRREAPEVTPYVLQARFDTDEVFRKPGLAITTRKAQAGGAPVWSYMWRAPSPAYGGRYGTPHGMDVGPSFHDVRGGLNGANPESVLLADQLASAWVSFAATGNPNNPKTPDWPAYSLPARETLIFDRTTHVESDPRGKFREFWEKEPPQAG